MLGEEFTEQLARVKMMTDEDQETWDLSPNDVAALKSVLAERDVLARIAEFTETAVANDAFLGLDSLHRQLDELARIRRG